LRSSVARFVALGALAAASACIDRTPTEVGANQLVVQAVLDAAAQHQYVVVQTTDGAIADQLPVDGAIVRLTLPDGRVITAETYHDSSIVQVRFGEPPVTTLYRFSLADSGISIVPGGTYHLRIEVPDGRVVTGSTTVPSAAAVLASPGAGTPFDLATDTLSLTWNRIAGAASYEVRVESPLHQFTAFADTSIALNVHTDIGTVAFRGGVANDVVVSAVDENYYNYFRRGPDTFTGNGLISSVDGAVGVFGAVVEIRRVRLAVR
jgi:hypothetical protein